MRRYPDWETWSLPYFTGLPLAPTQDGGFAGGAKPKGADRQGVVFRTDDTGEIGWTRTIDDAYQIVDTRLVDLGGGEVRAHVGTNWLG